MQVGGTTEYIGKGPKKSRQTKVPKTLKAHEMLQHVWQQYWRKEAIIAVMVVPILSPKAPVGLMKTNQITSI